MAKLRPVARGGVAIALVVTSGCGAEIESTPEAADVRSAEFDSALAEAQRAEVVELLSGSSLDAEPPPLLQVLSDVDVMLIAEAAADPDAVVGDFLAFLPLGETSVPITDEERADTIFKYLAPDGEPREDEAFAWGQAVNAAGGWPEEFSFLDCAPSEACTQDVRAYVETSAAAPMLPLNRPEIEAFLRVPLVLEEYGIEIREVRHADAADRVARAVCIGGEPTIQYMPDLNRRYPAAAFAFVRAHEYAHWLLKHDYCGPVQPVGVPPVHTRELDADCEAGLIVAREIAFGRNLLPFVAVRFGFLGWSSAGGYPGAGERADQLWEGDCGMN